MENHKTIIEKGSAIVEPFFLLVHIKLTSQKTSLDCIPFLSISFWARGRAAGLSRGIFLGAEEAQRFKSDHPPRPERIHCAYPSRVSQPSRAYPCAAKTRPHRAPVNPAITSAPLVRSACAPEVGRTALCINVLQ